ncbi:MAG: hypothetical protein EON56_05660 [Alphaproteobacteria bacterium]|nr:MAG: hypothetical protein EON56_05660 [Alphaproteobacteria bacterium]
MAFAKASSTYEIWQLRGKLRPKSGQLCLLHELPAHLVQLARPSSTIRTTAIAATQEQTAGIEQVSRAIVQIDQATQQNAALVEEASEAAQALQEEADRLTRTVSTFHIKTIQQVDGSPKRLLLQQS